MNLGAVRSPNSIIAYIRQSAGGAIGAADRVAKRASQASGVAAPLDATGLESASVASTTVNVIGALGGDAINAQLGYASAVSASSLMARGAAGSAPLCPITTFYSVAASTSFSLFGFPPSLQAAGDVHLAQVSCSNGNNSAAVQVFSQLLSGITSVTRPAPPVPPTVTRLSGTHDRLSAVFNLGSYGQASWN